MCFSIILYLSLSLKLLSFACSSTSWQVDSDKENVIKRVPLQRPTVSSAKPEG